MKNYKPTVWGLQEIHFEFKDANGLKLKKWKKLPAKTNQNKVNDITKDKKDQLVIINQ